MCKMIEVGDVVVIGAKRLNGFQTPNFSAIQRVVKIDRHMIYVKVPGQNRIKGFEVGKEYDYAKLSAVFKAFSMADIGQIKREFLQNQKFTDKKVNIKEAFSTNHLKD